MKKDFMTEEEMMSVREAVCQAIEEHGWLCENGEYLPLSELENWTDEMFIEAAEAIYG